MVYDSLIENHTWDLCPLPEGQNAIGNKWVFKVKYNADGSIEKYKARLVVKGYSQKEGIDYNKTFAPVAKFNSIRTIIALAAHYNLELHQMDVVTAFLNGMLTEEIYMDQPEGFQQGKGLVCKLNRTLYGLQQSSREWYMKIHEALLSNHFVRSQADFSIYVYNEGGVIIALYVDDLLIASKDLAKIVEIKQALSRRFKMKDLGKAHYCLGIQIIRDRENKTIKLSQTRYADTILERFNMANCKPISTPMEPGLRLSKNMSPQLPSKDAEMENFPYQQAIGSIMYLMTGTRPDLAFAVGAVSQHMQKPGLQHWKAVKQILRYIQATKDWSLTYSGNDNNALIGYSDSDFAGCIDTARSTTGYVFTFAGAAITWSSKRQQSVAQSTSEAEYMGMSLACREATWIRALLDNLGHTQERPTLLYGDNQSCLALVKNPNFTAEQNTSKSNITTSGNALRIQLSKLNIFQQNL